MVLKMYILMFQIILRCVKQSTIFARNKKRGIEPGYSITVTLISIRRTRLPLPENRKREGYTPIFGVYMAVEKEGCIRVGDPVYECSE